MTREELIEVINFIKRTSKMPPHPTAISCLTILRRELELVKDKEEVIEEAG